MGLWIEWKARRMLLEKYGNGLFALGGVELIVLKPWTEEDMFLSLAVVWPERWGRFREPLPERWPLVRGYAVYPRWREDSVLSGVVHSVEVYIQGMGYGGLYWRYRAGRDNPRIIRVLEDSGYSIVRIISGNGKIIYGKRLSRLDNA